MKPCVLSREWRCSWSSADSSNYIWVIDNFIACKCASYIRDLTVAWCSSFVAFYDDLVASDFTPIMRDFFNDHDDVIKWKHFLCYWPFVRGIHRSPVNSPHKGQWRGALMFSFICAWINGWVNNGEAGDLRRHRAHYDVTVMYWGNHVSVKVPMKQSPKYGKINHRYQ